MVVMCLYYYYAIVLLHLLIYRHRKTPTSATALSQQDSDTTKRSVRNLSIVMDTIGTG